MRPVERRTSSHGSRAFNSLYAAGTIMGLALDASYGFALPYLQHDFTFQHVLTNLAEVRLVCLLPYVLGDVGDAISTGVFLKRAINKKGIPKELVHLIEENDYHRETVRRWYAGRKLNAIGRGFGQKAVGAIPGLFLPSISLAEAFTMPITIKENLED